VLSDDLLYKSSLNPRIYPLNRGDNASTPAYLCKLVIGVYMRLESTAKEDEYKVWMTDQELEELRRAAASHRDDLLIQLGGYVGLRAFEILKNKKVRWLT